MGDEQTVRTLTRILRAETCDHPFIAAAIEENARRISMMPWDDPVQLSRHAAGFADRLEDAVAYNGQPLDLYIREPWLSRWRKTCEWALLKARAECAMDVI